MMPAAGSRPQVGALGSATHDDSVTTDIGLYGAERVWGTFRTFGSENVRVLDGVMTKWRPKAPSKPRGEAPAARTFTPEFNRAMVGRSTTCEVLLDKRKRRLSCARRGPFPARRPSPAGLRGGNMPGRSRSVREV